MFYGRLKCDMMINLAICSFLFAVFGCNFLGQNEQDKKTPHFATVGAVVHGNVIESETGDSVADARIRLFRYLNEDCSGSFVERTSEILSNEEGIYNIEFNIVADALSDDNCFLTQMSAPYGSQLKNPEPKKFDVTFRSEPPYDSVRVDFILYKE